MDEPLPLPIPRRQTQASPLKTSDAAASEPGSAAELAALKRTCCKMLDEIHTRGTSIVQSSPLSLQYLTTLKVQLDTVARQLQISSVPVEPDFHYATKPPHASNGPSFPGQGKKPPSPPLTPPLGYSKPAANIQQSSRPAMLRRQTTGPFSTPIMNRARQAYNNGIKSGILNIAETSRATYEKENGWVLIYGTKKERKMPFKWFFNEEDQTALRSWRTRFEEAQRLGGTAMEMVGRAFAEAHPVVYYSGKYVRLGKYAERGNPAKGYRLATEK